MKSLAVVEFEKEEYRGGVMCQKIITAYVPRAHVQVMYLETGMKRKNFAVDEK